MKLYAHPFSSYSQKALIALYENDTPFEYRNLEEPSAKAELAAIWPLKRFPVLVDRERTILEATTIIEYLQIHYPGRVRLIPDGDAGVDVRMLDRVFDNYVMTPMQKIVVNQLRPEADRDAYGVPRHAGPREDLRVARRAPRRSRLGVRRRLHARGLRRGAVTLLCRLGARNSARFCQSASLSRAPAGSSVGRPGRGRGATLSQLLSAWRAGSRLSF